MPQLNLFALLDSTPLDDRIYTPKSCGYSKLLADLAIAPIVGLDIETYGAGEANGLDYYRGSIRLIQVGLPDGRVLIYDCLKDLSVAFIDLLKQRLADPNCIIVGHNILFDLTFIQAQLGFSAKQVRCTRIMSIMRWCGIKYYRHSLKDLTERLLGIEISKEQQKSDWAVPALSNSQLNYAAEDVRLTLKCYLELCRELQAFDSYPSLSGAECEYKLSEIVKIECNSIPAFASMMINGMPIDVDRADSAIEQYEQAIADLYGSTEAELQLPYSAQPLKLAKAVYDCYGIWLIDEDKNFDDEAEGDDTVSASQLGQLYLLAENYPKVPPGFKITTGSSTLFKYYLETEEEALLRLSLARSLKKCIDAIASLRDSALQNQGVARTRYSSLGNTGTGRSSASTDLKSSTISAQLQNLANPVTHPLLSKYNLPAPRDCMRSPDNWLYSINDYASSHAKILGYLSGDEMLAYTATLKDGHAYFTSQVMQALNLGVKYTVEYCENHKKDDPLVKKTRAKAKTIFYLSFNVGGVARAVAAFLKTYSVISYDECKVLLTAFKQSFVKITQWQKNVKEWAGQTLVPVTVKLKNGKQFTQHYAQYRTEDGRLIHIDAYPNSYGSSDRLEPKISAVTSSCLLSPEAIALKKTLTWCNDYIIDNSLQDSVKLVNAVHDEVVFLVRDTDEAKKHLLVCQQKLAADFNQCVHAEVMFYDTIEQVKTLCQSYAEK